MAQFTPAFQKLPKSIQDVLQFAIQTLAPQQIILFGSQARGDQRPNSDYDIAFKGVGPDQLKWSFFLAELEERPLTLLRLDLVRYELMNHDYQTAIDREGVSLYG